MHYFFIDFNDRSLLTNTQKKFFFPFFSEITMKHIEFHKNSGFLGGCSLHQFFIDFNRFWGAQHPNAGPNTQHSLFPIIIHMTECVRNPFQEWKCLQNHCQRNSKPTYLFRTSFNDNLPKYFLMAIYENIKLSCKRILVLWLDYTGLSGLIPKPERGISL